MITKIRSSSLSKYPDCCRRWAAQTLRAEVVAAGYDLRETPRSIAAPVGTGVHGGAAYLLKQKMLGDGEGDYKDAAIAALHEAVGEGTTAMDDLSPTMNTAERQVIRMADVYRLQIVPQVDPLVVEERMEAAAGPELILSGQGDNLCRAPNGLRDLKTGARNSGTHKPQLGSYSLLFRTAGFEVKEAAIDFIQRVKIDKPQPAAVSTTYNIAACEVAARRIIDHISRDVALFREGDKELGITAGDPWAFSANPSSMLCSDKWCVAWGTKFCCEHK